MEQKSESPFVIVTGIPKEYQEYVDAWSEFWYELGSKKFCGACFAGKLKSYETKVWVEGKLVEAYAANSKGCCNRCPNLGPTGCMQKPGGCASYDCGLLGDSLVPERLRRYMGMRGDRRYNGTHYRFRLDLGGGCYDDAVRMAAQRKWKPSELRELRRATQRIRRCIKWIKLSGAGNQNWPLIEKTARAVPGALTGA